MNDLQNNELLQELEKSIDNESLYLVFQPKMKSSEGIYKMSGVEILMRWTSNKFGFISPSVFIPLAEQSGFISKLEIWLIEEAVRSMAFFKTIEKLSDLTVSINISGKSLENDDLAIMIIKKFKEFNIQPQQAILEITESSKILNMEKATEVLNKLRDSGFGISIDDFCTGYGSMHYLKQFPATEIKIDKSFVNHITTNLKDKIIVEGLFYIAHKLDLCLIVEGVETKAQLECIEELSGHKAIIQGYYFSQPLTLEQLIDFSQKTF